MFLAFGVEDVAEVFVVASEGLLKNHLMARKPTSATAMSWGMFIEVSWWAMFGRILWWRGVPGAGCVLVSSVQPVGRSFSELCAA